MDQNASVVDHVQEDANTSENDTAKEAALESSYNLTGTGLHSFLPPESHKVIQQPQNRTHDEEDRSNAICVPGDAAQPACDSMPYISSSPESADRGYELESRALEFLGDFNPGVTRLPDRGVDGASSASSVKKRAVIQEAAKVALQRQQAATGLESNAGKRAHKVVSNMSSSSESEGEGPILNERGQISDWDYKRRDEKFQKELADAPLTTDIAPSGEKTTVFWKMVRRRGLYFEDMNVTGGFTDKYGRKVNYAGVPLPADPKQRPFRDKELGTLRLRKGSGGAYSSRHR
ncbi:hypothetical protein GUITHDRAFT_118083 [Guillardia theta CCMP2712]|uniref:Uncharacterized protein n=1 Tax=Guillardia theta (strain CCMP2712) TaxID=905079 RepID=L1IHU3_GUITC|nr:hypothetical protein GUITHDRAFT_118083 [Guillardia theta CCMP2712]EKX35808.1 hypothetical protein GUITHDRAFT_118083 [Guillardia theta CCMP2712]|eukprot:XP_005822788.1 hypothetical protein GUITHDRAFT_118083 [Guillardia theta CCMP2712]